MKQRIVEFGDQDIIFPYDGDPYIDTRTESPYQIKLDPYPAYSHPLQLTVDEVRDNGQKFPLPFGVTYHILSHEMLWRVNGCAMFNDNPLEGWIALSGKRIPIHPAITRSLIAHEYGHVVYGWIKHRFPEFESEYRTIRGIHTKDPLGPRHWHRTFEEIAVNDFRILMCKKETTFWPHDVPHPLKIEGLNKFWHGLRRAYAK